MILLFVVGLGVAMWLGCFIWDLVVDLRKNWQEVLFWAMWPGAILLGGLIRKLAGV